MRQGMVTSYETQASISANFPPLTNPSFYQNTIGIYNYRIGWHISCYHSIGTDDDIITDADVAQNFRAGRDIDAISNARRGAHTIPVSDGHLP